MNRSPFSPGRMPAPRSRRAAAIGGIGIGRIRGSVAQDVLYVDHADRHQPGSPAGRVR